MLLKLWKHCFQPVGVPPGQERGFLVQVDLQRQIPLEDDKKVEVASGKAKGVSTQLCYNCTCKTKWMLGRTNL
jgi:hypothetical protein